MKIRVEVANVSQFAALECLNLTMYLVRIQ